MTQQEWEELINEERVLELYKIGIERYGGDGSAPKRDCVDSALGNAWMAESILEAPKRGLIFAGNLLFYLAMKHCFTDGNKRIGWFSMVQVLMNLGLSIDATDEEAEEFVIDIVEGKYDQRGTVDWIAKRLIPLEQNTVEDKPPCHLFPNGKEPDWLKERKDC